MHLECMRKALMMSGVRAVPRSAEAHLPVDPHPAPKHDEGEGPRPRRPRKRKPGDEIAEGDAHQLDVEA
jgi:hypothetical protein